LASSWHIREENGAAGGRCNDFHAKPPDLAPGNGLTHDFFTNGRAAGQCAGDSRPQVSSDFVMLFDLSPLPRRSEAGPQERLANGEPDWSVLRAVSLVYDA
jgi:hypothetical protein